MDRIDFEAPAYTRCDCCPGITTHLTRFVSNAEGVFASYLVKFTDAHPGEAHAVVAIGDWSDTAGAEGRRNAFAFRLGRIGTDFNLAVVDAGASPFRGMALLGTMLSREAALAHPHLPNAHAIGGAMVEHDAAVKGFFGA